MCSGSGHRGGGEESGDTRSIGSHIRGRAALPQRRELFRNGDANDDETLRDPEEDRDDGRHDIPHVQIGLKTDESETARLSLSLVAPVYIPRRDHLGQASRSRKEASRPR